jgi:hypothetical protein
VHGCRTEMFGKPVTLPVASFATSAPQIPVHCRSDDVQRPIPIILDRELTGIPVSADRNHNSI